MAISALISHAALKDPTLTVSEATTYQQYLISAGLIVCGITTGEHWGEKILAEPLHSGLRSAPLRAPAPQQRRLVAKLHAAQMGLPLMSSAAAACASQEKCSSASTGRASWTCGQEGVHRV